MNNKSDSLFIFIFVIIFILKIIFYNIVDVSFFELGGGNDADYYADAAEGFADIEFNSWPVFLSLLNKLGIYSRSAVTIFLLLLSSIVIPFSAGKLAVRKSDAASHKLFWLVAIIVSIYPVLFFYSMDIYRDVFMVFIFVIGLFPIKNILERKKIVSIAVNAVVAFAIGGILFSLRGYLGFAYLVTVWFAVTYSFWGLVRKINLALLFVAYFLFIYIVFCFGLLDPLLHYRTGFEITDGGSNLNLDLTDPLLFIPSFILSWIYQMFGLWFSTSSAVALFFIESLPFSLVFLYILANKRFMTPFAWTLLVFFLVYATIWILGNDNLGSAWRLRSFSYLSILICFFNIRQEKLNRTIQNEKNHHNIPLCT